MGEGVPEAVACPLPLPWALALALLLACTLAVRVDEAEALLQGGAEAVPVGEKECRDVPVPGAERVAEAVGIPVAETLALGRGVIEARAEAVGEMLGCRDAVGAVEALLHAVAVPPGAEAVTLERRLSVAAAEEVPAPFLPPPLEEGVGVGASAEAVGEREA